MDARHAGLSQATISTPLDVQRLIGSLWHPPDRASASHFAIPMSDRLQAFARCTNGVHSRFKGFQSRHRCPEKVSLPCSSLVNTCRHVLVISCTYVTARF